MGIGSIQLGQLQKSQNHHLSLKKGQIIAGRVLKLFSNQMARVQFGGNRQLVAKLEAPLVINGNYYFQVEEAEGLPQLKILGRTRQPDVMDGKYVLHQLGLKMTKQTTLLLKQLERIGIPFTKNDLTEAFTLLKNAKEKPAARLVITRMMINHLPLTKPIFQALLSVETNTFSKSLLNLLQQLENQGSLTSTEKNLKDRLDTLIKPTTESKFRVRDISITRHMNKELFTRLQKLGVIPQSHSQSNGQNESMNSSDFTHIETSSMSPSDKRLFNQLQQLNNLSPMIKQKLSKWVARLQYPEKLDRDEFNHLKILLRKTVLPQLPVSIEDQINNTIDFNQSALTRLYQMLDVLIDPITKKLVNQLIGQIEKNVEFIKNYFIQQLKTVLQQTGLQHEYLEDSSHAKTSIQSLLLTLMGENTQVNKQSQQLLHFMNGLQLNAVHSAADFIQAVIQLPGTKLGLNQDIKLEFEGKKGNDGMICADDCRVVFYLNLTNMNETIIDMNVQKCVIAITIYNHQHDTLDKGDKLKMALKLGLKQIGYSLSSIRFKPLTETKRHNGYVFNKSFQETKGVDFHI